MGPSSLNQYHLYHTLFLASIKSSSRHIYRDWFCKQKKQGKKKKESSILR